MTRIIILYREVDFEVGIRLRDHLEIVFGSNSLFILSDQLASENILNRSLETLNSADVVLILIGENWVKGFGGFKGSLFDSDNPIRKYTEVALNGGKHLIPILLDQMEFSKLPDLPSTVQRITTFQAMQLRNDPNFAYDVLEISNVITQLPFPTYATQSIAPMTSPSQLLVYTAALAIVLLAVFGVLQNINRPIDVGVNTLTPISQNQQYSDATSTAVYYDLQATSDAATATAATQIPTELEVAVVSRPLQVIYEAGKPLGNGVVRLFAPATLRVGITGEIRVEIQVNEPIPALGLSLNPPPSATPILDIPRPTRTPLPLVDSQFVVVREFMGAGLRGGVMDLFEVNTVPPSGIRRMYQKTVNWWKWNIRPKNNSAVGVQELEVYIYLPQQLDNGVEFNDETNTIPFTINVLPLPTVAPALTAIMTDTSMPTVTPLPSPTATSTPTPTPTYTPTPTFIKKLVKAATDLGAILSIVVALFSILGIGGVIAVLKSLYIDQPRKKSIEELRSSDNNVARRAATKLKQRGWHRSFKELHLPNANLQDADLSDFDLTGAELVNTNLKRANLRGTTLNKANLGGADLSEAELNGASVSEAVADATTILPDKKNYDPKKGIAQLEKFTH